jgi:hypothetical protein
VLAKDRFGSKAEGTQSEHNPSALHPITDMKAEIRFGR